MISGGRGLRIVGLWAGGVRGEREGGDIMIQCEQCEHFSRDEATGRVQLRCNPFSTIKEPACLEKLQLLRLDALLAAYHATLRGYQKLAPMQEKMLKMMEREIEELDETDSWKRPEENEEEEGPEGYGSL